MDYTVKLTEAAQAGFDYRASITGETVEDMIQRRVEEIGVSFSHDLKRAKVQELITKIQDDPDAYIDVITPIYDAKVAVLEAESAAMALVEEELK